MPSEEEIPEEEHVPEKKLYVCKYCGEAFETSIELARHVRNVHKREKAKERKEAEEKSAEPIYKEPGKVGKIHSLR